MISKFQNRSFSLTVFYYPLILLIFTVSAVSCNLSGEGIYRSIARAPEISKEIKEVLEMTADGIIGIVTDSSRYLLVHKGSAVYAYSFSDPEDVSWKRIEFTDEDDENQMSMGGEFYLTDGAVLHYVKESTNADAADNENFTSIFSLDISGVISESFNADDDKLIISAAEADETETSLPEGSSLEFFSEAGNKLFFLSADTNGSFSAAALETSASPAEPVDVSDVSRFHASKIGASYYLFISGMTEENEETALVLPYTSSSGFGTAVDITSSFDEDGGSAISGCLSAAVDGMIYLSAGNYFYTYDGNDLEKLDADTVYPDDFDLSSSVYAAADADEETIYFSGSSALYALSNSDGADDGVAYEISEEASDIAGGIQDLFFDGEENVLYLAKGNSWIWKYDPSAAVNAFSQLF